MPLAILDHRFRFPSPGLADAEGLVAIGGDLSVPRLLLAYRSGIFPWTVDPITWWSPEPRAISSWTAFTCRAAWRGSFARACFASPWTALPAGDARLRGPAPRPRSTWISPEFIEA